MTADEKFIKNLWAIYAVRLERELEHHDTVVALRVMCA